MADDAEDVPPLEDMSEVLKQLEQVKLSNVKTEPKSTKENKTNPQLKQDDHGVSEQSRTASTSEKNAEKKPQKSTTTTFAGMKKGFLFGSGAKPKEQSKAKTTTTEDIPFIKANNPSIGSDKVQPIPEVQEALKNSTPLLQDKKWVTDSLLSQFENNPDLMKRMSDPRFTQALTKFQTNPQEAVIEYQHDKEMHKFFSDVSAILGDHFTKLSDKEDSSNPVKYQNAPGDVQIHEERTADIKEHNPAAQPSQEDIEKMQAILSDPEIRSIIEDVRIQKLIESLRKDPDSAQELLTNADVEMRIKIHKLVDAGLLAITAT
ncbi:uncharacterized protein LOC100371987 [Saccoglossus kowalevskii]|uniref:Uncharacterized protein LOC100371987 n=1 Tax=Saccoglossus kowalevskii TaxID=10224 RepID=A0ABM0GXP1_SACKO|nr:PREDICTED: uncharacterized protein LOC100371987 [Saccoglossus kowalevskii]